MENCCQNLENQLPSLFRDLTFSKGTKDEIFQIYKVKESEYNDETISDAIITRIATKDCV